MVFANHVLDADWFFTVAQNQQVITTLIINAIFLPWTYNI
jgi:hypothetical protein